MADLTHLKVTTNLESDTQDPHIVKSSNITTKEKKEENKEENKEDGNISCASSDQKTNSVSDTTSFSTSSTSTLVMVPPGRIVHIYKKNGTYSILCTYKLRTV